MKKWVIKNRKRQNLEIYNNNLISNLLLSRGIDNRAKAEEFFYPPLDKSYNPYLLKDMDRAVEKIDDVIRKREKIVIYGNYNVDGIASTSILFSALKKIGVDVSYYIPDRINEGFGINIEAIEYLKCLQADLIITVDCGIASIKEVEYAKLLDMDIIVTDHHECREIVPNTIVINPKQKDCIYPFKSLAGCGVVYKLVQALWMKYGLSGTEEFLDIVSIGTVADLVELTDENRAIVKHGFQRISRSERCGIKALKAVTGIGDETTSYEIANKIAPRINAAGRLSDAKIAVELFTTNEYDKALQIAKYLDQENRSRQEIEDFILEDVLIKIKNEIDLRNDRVIVLSSPKWHVGVVGIVAAKVVEKYNRPTLLICEEGMKSRGSGRSIEGFNLLKNLSKCSDLLINYGGHEIAAGITIETDKIDKLRTNLNNLARNVDLESFADSIIIDMEYKNEDISSEAIDILKLFEPFGIGNPKPSFYMEGISPLQRKDVLMKPEHYKLYLENNKFFYDGIMFNGNGNIDDKWSYIDLAFDIGISNDNLIFNIRDIKPNKNWLEGYLKKNYYNSVRNIINYKIEKFDFNSVEFIKKSDYFLKEFAYFKRGYILVSSILSFEEVSFLFNIMESNLNKNVGNCSQIIICPDLERLEIYDNDILIYDFLPGEYDYSILKSKSENTIYNFFDSKLGINIDRYVEDLKKNMEIEDAFNNKVKVMKHKMLNHLGEE